jgi:hypothetical protein
LISVSYFSFSRAAMIALRFLHGCRIGFESRVPMRGVNRCYKGFEILRLQSQIS